MVERHATTHVRRPGLFERSPRPERFRWLGAGAFIEVESGLDADEINTVRAGADYGWPTVNRRTPLTVRASPCRLPAGTLPSGHDCRQRSASPFDGDLIVSSLGVHDLLRDCDRT